MAGTTTNYSLPYPESTDLVASYPALGQDLAEDLDTILAAKLDASAPVGKILQVVSATYSTQVTSSSSTYVTTGLSASITPSSTSSKIIALATIHGGKQGTTNYGYYRLFRGTVAGTAIGPEVSLLSTTSNIYLPVTLTAEDAPSTASAQTYTLGMKTSEGVIGAQWLSLASQIILMEVAA